MNYFDKGIYISIAIFYNLFIHHLVNMSYRDLPYDEKFEKSTTFLFVAGIAAIVLSKIILQDNKKYTDSILSMGFGVGGSLLVLTAIFVNWENLSDDIRLCSSAVLFSIIVWYAYKYENSNTKTLKK
jgi:hypothetical protein